MRDLEHPEIGWALRTGYPSCRQEREESDYDEDSCYEESREAVLFGDDE